MKWLKNWRSCIYWLSALIIFCIFQFLIFDKEKLIADGDTIFLALAPVDPRSFMQGNYMEINYKINRDIPYSRKNKEQNNGFAIVQVDQNSIAEFYQVYDKQELAKNEYLVRFEDIKFSRINVKPNHFFFQEDRQYMYEALAKYAALRCDKAGNCLLTDLTDSDLVILNDDYWERVKDKYEK